MLSKVNGLNATANILGALSGTPTNYIPHVNDYNVIIQKAEDGIAYVEVIFYDSKIYHDLLTFAADNGQNFLETQSSEMKKAQFNYDKYSFSLVGKANNQSRTTASRNNATTKDESYSEYRFVIDTGLKPFSEWHKKQEAKAARRDKNNQKKNSAADLM